LVPGSGGTQRRHHVGDDGSLVERGDEDADGLGRGHGRRAVSGQWRLTPRVRASTTPSHEMARVLSYPASPSRDASAGSAARRAMAWPMLSPVGSATRPLTSWSTNSSTPPLSVAVTTGRR